MSFMLVLVLGGGYAYAFLHVRALNQQSAALATETAALEKQESDIGQLRLNVKATDENLQNLNTHFIHTSDPVPFLTTVEDYGRTASVSTKFDAVSAEKKPDRLNVSITAQGTFAAVYRFLSLLEAIPYQIQFTEVNAQSFSASADPNSKQKPQTIWEARISLSVLSIIPAEQ